MRLHIFVATLALAMSSIAPATVVAESTRNLNVRGDLKVRGDTTLKDLVIKGGAEVNELTCSGSAELNAVSIKGSADVNTLTVKGATELNGLNVKGATVLSGVTVSGNAEVGGLAVTGQTDVNGLTVKGNTELNNVTIKGNAVLSIPASSVLIESQVSGGPGTASLVTSTNLQDALDNELAIDVASMLKGATWTIENVTSDVVHKGTTGVVSFNETKSTLSIVSGNFAAAGVVHSSAGTFCFIPSAEIDYRLFGNDLMYLSWKGSDRNNPSSQFDQDATMTVFASDPDTLRIVGNGGCGEVGKPRISILRKVKV